jgi:hypothetical protein
MIVLLLLVACEGVFNTLPGLNEPKYRSGRNVSHDYEYTDEHGRRLSVRYDVVEREVRVLALDTLAPLKVGLREDLLKLTFAVGEQAERAAGKLEGSIVVGTSDGAGFLQRVIDVTRISEVELECATEHVGWVELFEQGEMHVSVRYAGQDFELASRSKVKADPGPRDGVRRLGWKSWIAKGFSIIKEIGDNARRAIAKLVVDVLDFAGVDGDILLDGELEFALINFNYEDQRPCTIDLGDMFRASISGECKECYVYAGVTFHFGMVISRETGELPKVDELYAYADGTLAANVELEALKVDGNFEGNAKHIDTYRLKPVQIKLPIASVFISANVPVSLQPEAEASGELSVEGGAGASANLIAGVKFRGGKPELFEEFEASANAEGFTPIKFKGEAAVRIRLLTTVEMNVGIGALGIEAGRIGGPTVAVEVSPEAMLSGEYDFASGEANAEAKAMIGVDGAIGLRMELKLLPDKEKDLLNGAGAVDPKGIFSQKFQLGATDFGGGRRLANWDCAKWTQKIGTTWTGSQIKHPSQGSKCSDTPVFQYLTVQLVEVEDCEESAGYADMTFYSVATLGDTDVATSETLYTEVDQLV